MEYIPIVSPPRESPVSSTIVAEGGDVDVNVSVTGPESNISSVSTANGTRADIHGSTSTVNVSGDALVLRVRGRRTPVFNAGNEFLFSVVTFSALLGVFCRS
ncbi:MAG: hypothetical protein ACHQ1H_02635 [Nitrososphaerales archaeon]